MRTGFADLLGALRYREIGDGVFRSADALRQFRIDSNSIAGNHAPNVHLRRDRLGGRLAVGVTFHRRRAARRWTCRSCTPGSQSWPNVADGPIRGSSGTPASRTACTYARSCSIRART